MLGMAGRPKWMQAQPVRSVPALLHPRNVPRFQSFDGSLSPAEGCTPVPTVVDRPLWLRHHFPAAIYSQSRLTHPSLACHLDSFTDLLSYHCIIRDYSFINMRILAARRVGPVPRVVKSDSSVQDHELDATGDGVGVTQSQDAADMQKLGMQQQTKASGWIHLS